MNDKDLKTEERIKKIAYFLNGDKEINWNLDRVLVYSINWDIYSGGHLSQLTITNKEKQFDGLIYCYDQNFREVVEKKFKKENCEQDLIEYYKNRFDEKIKEYGCNKYECFYYKNKKLK